MKKRSELDSDIITAIASAGIFYTEQYHDLLLAQGKTPMFLYDENFIILIGLKQRGFFRFADLPVEQYKYSNADNANAQVFLDLCCVYMKTELKLHWVNPPETSARFHVTPSQCLKIPYGNYIVDITQPEEEIWKGFDSVNRNRIRKAEKEGIEVRFGGQELLDDFYALDVATYKRSGRQPSPKDFYQKQLDCLKGMVKIVVAYYQGVPQGATLIFCDQCVCFYMYSGTVPNPAAGTVNLLVWRMLQEMKDRNMQTFSFVGARVNPDRESKNFGINRFKKHFASRFDEYFLFKVVFNVGLYKIYNRIRKIRYRLNGIKFQGDIIDQEIKQWKSLNDPDLLKLVYPHIS